MQTTDAGRGDIAQVLITEAEIAARVRAVGAAITKDYQGKAPVLVFVMKGALIFVADLIRQIDLPLRIDFLVVSSYHAGTTNAGVTVVTDLRGDIRDRDVIVVEDIVDTGLTLQEVLGRLAARQPASLAVCALLDKPARRRVPVDIRYVGFTVPDEFVVGYCLDYGERYRNLPFIGVLKPEVYIDAGATSRSAPGGHPA
ncbi:MAG: hypoxanthine phosphoribosyltransferase [Dehalococcoidia bacterium]